MKSREDGKNEDGSDQERKLFASQRYFLYSFFANLFISFVYVRQLVVCRFT